MAARSISCSAWPAATRTFFGVQPRFGQVPPRSCDSIIATDIPARLAGPVTPMPALPPPRMTTSNFSLFIERIPVLELFFYAIRPRHRRGLSPLTWVEWAVLLGRDRRGDGTDHLGGHLEL